MKRQVSIGVAVYTIMINNISNLDILGAIASAIALGISLLTISTLASRKDPRFIYKPLIVFFVANAMTEAPMILALLPTDAIWLSFTHVLDIGSIVAFMVLGPALWFYVRGITSEYKVDLSRRDVLHCVPLAIAVLVCIGLLLIPFELRDQIIGDSQVEKSTPFIVFSILLILLMLIWAVQCSLYVAAIIRRLIKYKVRLKDVYASTEQHELTWIAVVTGLLVSTLVFTVCSQIIDLGFVLGVFEVLFDLAMVWCLAHWGLRQLPALEGYGRDVASADLTPNALDDKYKRSGLGKDQVARIADKLEGLMLDKKPYLDPDLSLPELAKAVSVLPNYVSQTLNGKLHVTFFDYINSWRIRDACPLVLKSNQPIADIAHQSGFNSRSSFYKAFKLHTGLTPTEYRKRNRSGDASV